MADKTPGEAERELGKLLKDREDLVKAQDAIERARKGDESALPAVRKYLDEKGPGYLDIVDLARIAKETQIKRVFGPEELVAREAMERKSELMREEIVGPDPSPLEGLLADRVILCWIQLYYAEIKQAERAVTNIAWTEDEYNQKRVDRLQRRYLAAIKGLAQVRKLLRPSVQINVAEQLVNVAGDVKR